MGASVSGQQGGTMAEMNVVPLIDVLLVLIILFMVIAPAAPKGLAAQIPQPQPPVAGPQPAPVAVVVQVLADGKLRLNGESQSWATLGTRIEQIFRQRADKVVFVHGDAGVLFSEVAQAINVVRASGIEKVGLMTARTEAGE